MIFFATSIIDVVHSLIRMVRGLNRKEKQENDLEMLELKGEDPKEAEERRRKE